MVICRGRRYSAAVILRECSGMVGISINLIAGNKMAAAYLELKHD